MTDPIANLLPCPFCGAEPCFEKPSPTAWEIVCRAMSCCFNPSTGWMQNKDGCITIWNTRALPAPPAPEVVYEIPERLFKASRNDAIVNNYFRMPMEPKERLERIIEAMAERQEIMVKKMIHLLKNATIPPLSQDGYWEFMGANK